MAVEAEVDDGAAPSEKCSDIVDDVTAKEAQEDDPLYSMEDIFGCVRKHLYDAPIEEREDRREELLRTRFRLPLNRVRVGPSTRHGLGVFAKRRILADELVTMYPGDALRFYPISEDGGVGSERSGVLFGQHVPEAMRDDAAVMTKYRPFTYDVDGMYAVVGLPDLTSDPAYAGHMVNDASTCSEAPADRERYHKQSMADCNATFEGLLDAAVAIVASRPIAEGEEVLVAYGPEYWTSLEKLKGVQVALAERAHARGRKDDAVEKRKGGGDSGESAEKRRREGGEGPPVPP